MLYHCTFHHSYELHVNHMIFLPVYLFGIFTIAALGGWFSSALVAVPFFLYTMLIVRPHIGAGVYVCIVGAIAASSNVFCQYLTHDSNLNHWMAALVGVGIVLTAFCFQLVGHGLHEGYVAPPNLAHGFFAAPVLEFQSFLYRTRLRDICDMCVCEQGEYEQLQRLVAENRQVLIEQKNRTQKQGA